jgi:hypothetical protein
MWTICLRCDGCGERIDALDHPLEDHPEYPEHPDFRSTVALARKHLPRGLPRGIRAHLAVNEAIRARTRSIVRRRGWEQVVSPDDGEEWYCPQCRLARDRETLVPVAG